MLKRKMDEELERSGIKKRIMKNRRGKREMLIIKGMRGEGNGKIGIIEEEGIRREDLEKRKRMNGFDGRKRECRELYVEKRKKIEEIEIEKRDGKKMEDLEEREKIKLKKKRIDLNKLKIKKKRKSLKKMKNY